MTTVRKTISLPSAIVAEVEAEAEVRGLSFSAVVAERLSRRRRLSVTGILDAEPDLSLRVEEILARAFREG